MEDELQTKIEAIKLKAKAKFHANHDDGDLAINDAVNDMSVLIQQEIAKAKRIEQLETLEDFESQLIDGLSDRDSRHLKVAIETLKQHKEEL